MAAAELEVLGGDCPGCKVFGLLMQIDVVLKAVCTECADVSGRLRAVRS